MVVGTGTGSTYRLAGRRLQLMAKFAPARLFHLSLSLFASHPPILHMSGKPRGQSTRGRGRARGSASTNRGRGSPHAGAAATRSTQEGPESPQPPGEGIPQQPHRSNANHTPAQIIKDNTRKRRTLQQMKDDANAATAKAAAKEQDEKSRKEASIKCIAADEDNLAREDADYSLRDSRPDLDVRPHPAKKLKLTTSKHIILYPVPRLTFISTANEAQELPESFLENDADGSDGFNDIPVDSVMDSESNDDRDFTAEEENQSGTEPDYVDPIFDDMEPAFEDDQEWQDDVSIKFHTRWHLSDRRTAGQRRQRLRGRDVCPATHRQTKA